MKNALKIGTGFLASALLGAGCVTLPTPATTQPVTHVQSPQTEATDWQTVERGMDRRVYTSSTLQAAMIVYRLDSSRYEFHFETTSGTQTMAQWSAQFPQAALIVNGVYFHDDNLPSGYLVSRGHRIGDRSFDLDKSGVIDLTGGVHIYDTSVNPPKLSAFSDAAQSYPLFIKNGKPAIKEDSQKPARRSFIGKDTAGNVYIGVIPSAQISLYQTMLMLGETGIEWANVINLDGGPSTGLYAHPAGNPEELPSLFPIPNVLVVTRT
jgi:exopolysaccharide biosynthesis protein